jgi:hypothetical protein
VGDADPAQLAAGQRRGGPEHGEVAEAHFDEALEQGVEPAADRLGDRLTEGLRELQQVGQLHPQHVLVADVADGHLPGGRTEPGAAAGVARLLIEEAQVVGAAREVARVAHPLAQPRDQPLVSEALDESGVAVTDLERR